MPEAEAVSVPIKDWTDLHRRLGMAEGLLRGWLMHDDENRDLCRTVTARFLDGGDDA